MNIRIIGFAICFLFGLALSQCAHAEPLTVGLHAVSYHAPEKGQQNVNPGLYVRGDDWQIGMYRNSYRKPTIYAAYSWQLGDGYELFTGGATGYKKVWHHGPIAPMVAFSKPIDFRVLGMRPRVTFMLPTPKTSAVVHLSAEF